MVTKDIIYRGCCIMTKREIPMKRFLSAVLMLVLRVEKTDRTIKDL